MVSPTVCYDLGAQTLDSSYMKCLIPCGNTRSNRQHGNDPCSSQFSRTAPGKDPADPASYRGIYLSSALAKLFEGILIFRLTQSQVTEAHNTLTENQLGTRPGRQVHDAIYILLSIIQHNYIKKGLPTYVSFLDYSTPGSLLRFACVLICAFGAFGAGTVALTSPRKHFTRQVELLSGHRIN